MKKLLAVILLLPTLALAGDLHMLSHAAKAGKASAKAGAKVLNKARKQVL